MDIVERNNVQDVRFLIMMNYLNNTCIIVLKVNMIERKNLILSYIGGNNKRLLKKFTTKLNRKMIANSNLLNRFHLISVKLVGQESKIALETSQKKKH